MEIATQNHLSVHVNMNTEQSWIDGPISLPTKRTKTSIRTDNKSENNNTYLYNEMILEVCILLLSSSHILLSSLRPSLLLPSLTTNPLHALAAAATTAAAVHA